MSIKFVTTLNPTTWGLTGRRFVYGFLKYWAHVGSLEVWCAGFNGTLPRIDGVTFKALEDAPTYMVLTQQGDTAVGQAQVPIALAMATSPELDWVVYMDCSIEWMVKPTPEQLVQIFEPEMDVVTLRGGAKQETSGHFMAFNLRRPTGASLLADFWGLYNTGEAFQYKNSACNAVFDRLVVLHQAHGLALKNLAAQAKGWDIFHQSIFGELGVSYVAPDFTELMNPADGQLGRYKMLGELVEQVVGLTKKANLVEVGTWNGGRAVQMAQAAFKAGVKEVKYVGFDTFEEGQDQEHEVNVKTTHSLESVRRRLDHFATAMSRRGLSFSFKLIKGNTLRTLPKSLVHTSNATFAWIDGGHSEETVKSDYAALKHVPYVVFDDVFPKEEEGVPKGPHGVWWAAAGQKQLVQTGDVGLAATQPICLGIVVHDGLLKPQLQSRIQVKPVDSVDKTEQYANIEDNSQALKEWLMPYQAHAGWALMVSAGPTLADFLPEIKQKQVEGASVFAVKHALPILKAAGIRPDYVVILDPRPVDGVSTHGVLRTDLFADVDQEDVFLIATMTHPSVRHLLEGKGARLWGWHAQTQITLDAKLPAFQKGMVIGGGTCSATRMPMLAFSMGFRRMIFYGYDFFYPAGTKQESIKQQLMLVSVGEKEKARQFLTTGELIAAMQDLGQWNQWMLQQQLTVEWRGEGAGATIWRQTAPNYRSPPEFKSNAVRRSG